MKKFTWLTILTALILALGCLGAAFAEIIPAAEPGQQIGYQAVVLCETLTLRESSSSSSKALQTLNYGELAERRLSCHQPGLVYHGKGNSSPCVE